MRNNNLWLVYSVKTDRDWLLPSDRQLIHWLHYLESNPDVASFDLAPEPLLSHDADEVRATELDATVVYKDGHIEWHEVKAKLSSNAKDNSQFLAQAQAASKAAVKYRRFDDTQFQDVSASALRWLKPLAFAEVIRGQKHLPCQTALASYLLGEKDGTVGQILSSMKGFEAPTVLGVLIRIAIDSNILIDLKQRSFGLQTKWRVHG
ncbi:MAG: hypothetical protein KGZ62_06145 [Sulfurimonas sp.]|nr:hypothetical protein [Sulfurimonas sp.]